MIIDENLIRPKLAFEEVNDVGIVFSYDARPVVPVIKSWMVLYELETLHVQLELIFEISNVPRHDVVPDHLDICLAEV